jgi:putative transcriptional regulator
MNPIPGDPPRHHPSEDLLLRHSAGRLPPIRALVVSTHLPFCAQCRGAVGLGEDIGGALLAGTAPDDMAADALSRTLARLDTTATPPAPDPSDAGRPAVELATGVSLPASLRGLARPRWRWLAPGISRMALDVPGTTRDERAYLLRIAPGIKLPEHGHTGWEATCVLSGYFTDSTGEYGPGDVAEIDGATIHQPISSPQTGCICLIVSLGDLRPRGVLARLMQPFVGV